MTSSLTKPQQEVKGWEEIHKMFDELVEYQDNYELRDKLSTIRWRIIGKFKHLLEANRKAIRKEIKGMKKYITSGQASETIRFTIKPLMMF